MISEQTKKSFETAYYSWAKLEWEREIDGDFPFLRQVKGGSVMRFVEILDSLSTPEQHRISLALLKRFHPKAVEMAREPMTLQEQDAIQQLDEARLTLSKREERMRRPDTSQRVQIKVDRKRLRNAIHSELERAFGDRTKELDRNSWMYLSQVGHWTIRTSIDVGGRYHQLTYEHSIVNTDSDQLARGISLTSWLGISSQMNWDLLTEGDVPETAQLLAKLCSHFVEAIPHLLEDISP